MDKFLPLLLVLFLSSCTTSEKKTNAVFFAGEIVNPTNEYVVLHKGRSVIDSVKLDGNNRFSFQLDSIEDGLYHFNHAPEYQYVYLEHGDSLLVRLNTVDFDESLVFSGSNEEINNFLLDLFLARENEVITIRKDYYDLEAKDFSEQINELKNKKLKTLDAIKVESKLSDTAYEIAKASIDYTYYKYLELYPFQHKRKLKENTLHELPGDFYDYRKNINYNNAHLNYLRPYYDFMKSHVGNLSYMTCSHGCGVQGDVVSNQLHFNQHKLHIIDSLVVEKELRDNLFRNVAFNYLLKEHDAPQNNEIFIKDFQEISGSNMHNEEIEILYSGIKNIQPNKPIPNIQVISFDGEITTLPAISKNKKVIFYFWSATDKNHYENIFKRIKKLEDSKPGYELVGINMKTDTKNWKGIVNYEGLDANNQYHAANFKELAEALVLYPMNKCIMTQDAVIVDAFANIYKKLEF